MPHFLARFFTSGRAPSWLMPAALGVLSVLADLGGKSLRLALEYERDALAGGEFWRLLTAHIAHLGHSHMMLDVAALAILTLLFKPFLGIRDWLVITLTSVSTIDLGLYLFNPSIQWYVGLSGLLHGYWAAGCLYALEQRHRQVFALLILLIGKLLYEALAGSVPLTEHLSNGMVVTAAHLWGAIGGAAGWLLVLATRSRRRPL